MQELPRQEREAALSRTAIRILDDDVRPFWELTVDFERGGYRLNHDAQGRWRGPCEKSLVTQARMLWFFSRLSGEDRAARRNADVGYQFMRDHMWDKEHGGFYWAVKDDGKRPTKAGKHLYGQAFALFALSEYAQMSGEADARTLCRDLFSLVDDHAYDAEHLGYRESFARDWRPARRRAKGYLGVLGDRKLFNTHLHLLEAVTSLLGFDESDRTRRRLQELIVVCSETVVDDDSGSCRDEFYADWTPIGLTSTERCSYGHDLENVALLYRAADALGSISDDLLARCRRICQQAITNGHDRERGGFFAAGPLGMPADSLEKIYWVQAEAMFGLTTMWRSTRSDAYLDCLTATMSWIDEVQVDRVGGDWHSTVDIDGVPSGSKANEWKDPYHQTRALLEVWGLGH
jgi:cellobiose epimerase